MVLRHGDALVGIFLDDTLPINQSGTLRFYVTDSSIGGIPTNFTALTPRIGEVFFIGDGLTGTGTGTIQKFMVPPSATNLYMGYVDGTGVPEGYTGNAGELTVILQLHQLD